MSLTLRERDHLQDDFSSDSNDVCQFCFSSDSSLYTPVDGNPTKVKAWWKPKRKLVSIQEASTAEDPRSPKEDTGRLWKRGSRNATKVFAEKELMEKIERKLQAKRAAVNAAAQASDGRILANRRSNTHPAYRGNKDAEPNASTHILAAMQNSDIPSLPSSHKGKASENRRGSRGTTRIQHRNSSPSLGDSARSGLRRPYKPSPLKHVTRVTSMDVNKSLPPLPPERQVMMRYASKVDLGEVVGVRKVGVRKVGVRKVGVRKVGVRRVINEYVGEMAKAY
jgi:hypothetical protein